MPIKINGTNTAANPSITGDDTDTGIVYGSDQIDFSTGGSSKVTLNGSNLGVGTTSPNAQLEVKNTGNVKIYADSSGGYIQQDVSNLDDLHLISSGDIKYQSDPENDTSHTNHIFECDGSEKFRIDASGNLGIGTSNPTNQLRVYDGAAANDTPEIKIESFRPAIRFKDRSGSSVSSEIVGDNALLFRVSTPVDDSTALTERMRIDSSGNIGIGTTSPTEFLQIHE